MKRRIIKADVKRLALCKRGVNTLQTLYKADGTMLSALVKAAPNFDEQGELLFVVAVPGMAFADGDFYETPAAVRDSLHSFMRNGAEIDVEHMGKALTKAEAFIGESFIIQEGDPRFLNWKNYDDEIVDVTGGWGGVACIGSDSLRKSYRAGDWDGISLFAPASGVTLELVKSETDLERKIRAAIKLPTEDDDVKTEEITAAVAAGMKPVHDLLLKAFPEPKAGEKPSDDAPEFEGDPSSLEDLEKHEAVLAAHTLKKSGALKDPKRVAELVAKARAAQIDPKTARAELRKSNPTLAKALDDKEAAEARVAVLQKSSNQPAGAGEEKSSRKGDGTAHPFVTADLVKGEDPQGQMDSAFSAADDLNRKRYPHLYAHKN